jgi:hypothetical protein
VKKLLTSAALVTLLAASPALSQQVVVQPPGALAGNALVAAPTPAAFTFTGSIVVNTVGSITTGFLEVLPSAGAAPPAVPIGSLLSGTGITTGTVVQKATQDPYIFAVTTTGGTIAGVNNITITATPKLSFLVQDTIQKTAPTYASGGCTAGSPAFVAGSLPFNWAFTNGSGTCGAGNTVTFTFPAAAVSWSCTAQSTLNPTTDIYVSTGAASTTAVVLTDYSAAGAAQNTKANDVITGSCIPR